MKQLLFYSFTVLWCGFILSCTKDSVRPEPEVIHPALEILAPSQYLTDAELPLDIIVKKGTNDVGQVLVNVHGDSANYDTALTARNTAAAETLHVRPSFSRSGQYRVSAQTTTADTTVRAQKDITLQDLVIRMIPQRGPAPLNVRAEILTNGSVTPSAHIVWGDGRDTSLVIPSGFRTVTVPHRYGLGTFNAELICKDTLQTTVEAYNTPPHQTGSLPAITGTRDSLSTFNSIALRQLFSDSLSGRDSLRYRLVSNDGPVRVSVDSNGVMHADSLRLHGYGPSNAVVEVADPQGMTTQTNITTETRFVPLLTLCLQAYNGEAENNGSIIFNGQSHLITPTAPQLELLLNPGLITISGNTLNADTAASYYRTIDANVQGDTAITMDVFPYRFLQNICDKEGWENFIHDGPTQTINANGQYLQVITKMDMRQASQGFQNGGVTIYIEKQTIPLIGVPSDTLSDDEQEHIKNILLTQLNPYFSPENRPQIVKAQWEDSTYIVDNGPTHEGLILIFKRSNTNSGAATYINNQGRITGGLVFINQYMSPRDINQETLTDEMCPGEIIDTPFPSVLDSHWGTDTVQPADSLLIDFQIKTPFQLEFDHYFSILSH